jgi:hypothetical protein
MNQPFAVADILSKGVVSPNTCSKKIVEKLEPGVLTIFIRPLTWWEKFVGALQA